ncbi:uncharacterized protein EI90DRAFT_3130557 [Cantharellus anzutake]|uniref:uncharacterized protein n=1 Tax=Cantharellus anzutake TaxID=1750568 RepID=UPI0019058835|nr:uncharacterized protein EI90DRAFT_3130557 [Cantharellus anzutake]KAF8322941.1 hypothetical protein EI90DRAFT_3130557 [Cantharellus anzutake]
MCYLTVEPKWMQYRWTLSVQSTSQSSNWRTQSSSKWDERNKITDLVWNECDVEINGHTEKHYFDVINIDRYNAIFGTPWLNKNQGSTRGGSESSGSGPKLLQEAQFCWMVQEALRRTWPQRLGGSTVPLLRLKETAWTQILGLFNHQLLVEQRSTWVDVGLEIHRREFVLHWDASKHNDVFQVLAHGYQGEVERGWTTPEQEGYFCDVQAGILLLASGHCALPHHAQLPVYAQWYASEKAVARRADKFHPMLEISKKNVLLEKNQKKLQQEFNNLDQVWSLANKECTEGTARMEICVPLGKARNALKRGITREFIKECIIFVPAGWWWVQPYALELTAALLWHINMLNSRPATGSSEHALMCASLPVTVTSYTQMSWMDVTETHTETILRVNNVTHLHLEMFSGSGTSVMVAPPIWPLDEDHFNHLLLSATLYTAARAPFHLPRPHCTEAPPVLEPEHELPANLHVKLKKHDIKHLRTAYSAEDHHSTPQLVQGTTSIIYTKSLHQIIQYFYSNVLQTIPVPQTPSSEVFYHIVCDPDNPVTAKKCNPKS